jgi:hypothetical protein
MFASLLSLTISGVMGLPRDITTFPHPAFLDVLRHQKLLQKFYIVNFTRYWLPIISELGNLPPAESESSTSASESNHHPFLPSLRNLSIGVETSSADFSSMVSILESRFSIQDPATAESKLLSLQIVYDASDPPDMAGVSQHIRSLRSRGICMSFKPE